MNKFNFLIAGLICIAVSAQTAQPDQATIRSFDLLFRRLTELQQPAANGQQSFVTQASNALQQKLNTDNVTMAALFQAATIYSAAVAPIDAEAATIIAAAKAHRAPANNPKGGTPVPPPPPRLGQLQQMRDGLILQALSNLSGTLGPDALTNLTNTVLANTSVKHL